MDHTAIIVGVVAYVIGVLSASIFWSWVVRRSEAADQAEPNEAEAQYGYARYCEVCGQPADLWLQCMRPHCSRRESRIH